MVLTTTHQKSTNSLVSKVAAIKCGIDRVNQCVPPWQGTGFLINVEELADLLQCAFQLKCIKIKVISYNMFCCILVNILFIKILFHKFGPVHQDSDENTTLENSLKYQK